MATLFYVQPCLSQDDLSADLNKPEQSPLIERATFQFSSSGTENGGVREEIPLIGRRQLPEMRSSRGMDGFWVSQTFCTHPPTPPSRQGKTPPPPLLNVPPLSCMVKTSSTHDKTTPKLFAPPPHLQDG